MLEAFAARIPAHEARDTLMMYHAVVLGSGNVKPSEARRAIRALQRQAGSGQGKRRKSVKPATREEWLAAMTASGGSSG